MALLLLLKDAPFGRLIVRVGQHALVVQLGELLQMGYPRRLVGRGRGRGLGGDGWRNGRDRPGGHGCRGGRRWWRGRGGAGAGRGQQLLARGIHPELAPEPLDLRHVGGLGEPPGAERPGRAGHRAYGGQLCAAELKTPAADGAHEVVVCAVGHDRHEVEAEPLLRPDVVKEDLVVAVRADGRRDLTQVLLLARPEAENDHAAIETRAPRPYRLAALPPGHARAPARTAPGNTGTADRRRRAYGKVRPARC